MARGRRARGTPTEEAKALALRILSFHARSEAQLRARLIRAGFELEAETVVAWARQLGYVDDGAYARGRAAALLRRVGPRLAERRLQSEGIDVEPARHAVAAVAEERTTGRAAADTAETALCRAALDSRLRGQDVADLDERARARLARFLLGRGFSSVAVSRAFGGADAGA